MLAQEDFGSWRTMRGSDMTTELMVFRKPLWAICDRTLVDSKTSELGLAGTFVTHGKRFCAAMNIAVYFQLSAGPKTLFTPRF
jgi:hypothetical protein